MLEGLVSRTPDGHILRVREVWDDNLDEEMAIIRNVVDLYPFLAMDTEFPGALSDSRTRREQLCATICFRCVVCGAPFDRNFLVSASLLNSTLGILGGRIEIGWNP